MNPVSLNKEETEKLNQLKKSPVKMVIGGAGGVVGLILECGAIGVIDPEDAPRVIAVLQWLVDNPNLSSPGGMLN